MKFMTLFTFLAALIAACYALNDKHEDLQRSLIQSHAIRYQNSKNHQVKRAMKKKKEKSSKAPKKKKEKSSKAPKKTKKKSIGAAVGTSDGETVTAATLILSTVAIASMVLPYFV